MSADPGPTEPVEAPPAEKPPRRKRTAPVTINRLFKTLLWINAGMWVTTGLLMAWIGLSAPADGQVPELRRDLFKTCEKVFVLTSGTFIGLLGGRAAAPDPK